MKDQQDLILETISEWESSDKTLLIEDMLSQLTTSQLQEIIDQHNMLNK